jgi:hypothetical protein
MMKKEYMKPEIMFESFSLSQNIAAGCEKKINGPSAGNCGLEFGAQTIFFEEMSGVCTFEVVQGGINPYAPDYNGLCYNTVSDTANIFNS